VDEPLEDLDALELVERDFFDALEDPTEDERPPLRPFFVLGTWAGIFMAFSV